MCRWIHDVACASIRALTLLRQLGQTANPMSVHPNLTHRALRGRPCNLLAVVAIAVLAMLHSAIVRAADWPMFGRDWTRNPVSPEKDPPLDWEIEHRDGGSGVSVIPARSV